MPKATLEFKLPEEQDEFRIASNAIDWALVSWDVKSWLREKLKYGHNYKTADEALEACQDQLFDSLESHGINLDMIP